MADTRGREIRRFRVRDPLGCAVPYAAAAPLRCGHVPVVDFNESNGGSPGFFVRQGDSALLSPWQGGVPGAACGHVFSTAHIYEKKLLTGGRAGRRLRARRRRPGAARRSRCTHRPRPRPPITSLNPDFFRWPFTGMSLHAHTHTRTHARTHARAHAHTGTHRHRHKQTQ